MHAGPGSKYPIPAIERPSEMLHGYVTRVECIAIHIWGGAEVAARVPRFGIHARV